MKKGFVRCIKAVTGLFTAFVIVSSFPSCQKEITGAILDSTGTHVDSIPISTSSRVKTYTEDVTTASGDHQSETFTLSYDANDRVISMVAASDTSNKFVYKYNANNTYSLDIYNQSVVNIHVDFFLNNFSLVDSTFQFNDTGDSTTEKYSYNSAKQLTVKNDYDLTQAFGPVLTDSHNYEYDANGNVIKETSNSGVITYEYDLSLANNLSLGLIYFYKNANLVKTTTSTMPGTTGTATHTYTFDNNNRQVTEKIVTNDGSIVLRSYTYY